MKTYQKDRGLAVDGALRPGGPTERTINRDLADKGVAGTAPTSSVPSGPAIPPRRLDPLPTAVSTSNGPALEDANRTGAPSVRPQTAQHMPRQASQTFGDQVKDAFEAGKEYAEDIWDKSKSVANAAKWALHKTVDLYGEPLVDAGVAAYTNATGTDDEIHAHLNELADKYERMEYTQSARYLRHFLNNGGKPIHVPRDEARKDPFIREAEEKNRERFENRTFLGKTESNTPVNNGLRNIKYEQTVQFSDDWDSVRKTWGTYGDIIGISVPDRDEALAQGRKDFKSKATFAATRKDDTIFIQGSVEHDGSETYDFEWDRLGHLVGARALQLSGHAKPFDIEKKWTQDFQGTVKVKRDPKTGKNILYGSKFTWTDRNE